MLDFAALDCRVAAIRQGEGRKRMKQLSSLLVLACVFTTDAAFATDDRAVKGKPGSDERAEYCGMKRYYCLTRKEDCVKVYPKNLIRAAGCAVVVEQECDAKWGSGSDCQTRPM
jgi:hypothetical protein